MHASLIGESKLSEHPTSRSVLAAIGWKEKERKGLFSNSDSDILNHLGSATLRCPQKCSRMLKSRTDSELCFGLLLSLFLTFLINYVTFPEHVFLYLMSRLRFICTAFPVSPAATNLKVEVFIKHWSVFIHICLCKLQSKVRFVFGFCFIRLWQHVVKMSLSYQDVVFYTRCFCDEAVQQVWLSHISQFLMAFWTAEITRCKHFILLIAFTLFFAGFN